MDNKFVRKTRKGCLKEKGEHNFDFNEFHERCIYKYAIGMDLKKKEYEAVCENNQFNTYEEWAHYIGSKYEKFDLATCIEFKKFLVQKFRNNKTVNATMIMVVTAIFTLILSKMPETIAAMEKYYIESISSGVNSVIFFPIFGVAILGFLLVLILMYKTIQPYWKDNEDRAFYADYINVIDGIITHKQVDKNVMNTKGVVEKRTKRVQ